MPLWNEWLGVTGNALQLVGTAILAWEFVVVALLPTRIPHGARGGQQAVILAKIEAAAKRTWNRRLVGSGLVLLLLGLAAATVASFAPLLG